MISQFRAKKKQPVKRKSGQPKPTAHLYKPSAHPVPILRMEWRSGALPGLKPPIGDQAGDEGNYKYAGAAIDDRGEGERDFRYFIGVPALHQHGQCMRRNAVHGGVLVIDTDQGMNTRIINMKV